MEQQLQHLLQTLITQWEQKNIHTEMQLQTWLMNIQQHKLHKQNKEETLQVNNKKRVLKATLFIY